MGRGRIAYTYIESCILISETFKHFPQCVSYNNEKKKKNHQNLASPFIEFKLCFLFCSPLVSTPLFCFSSVITRQVPFGKFPILLDVVFWGISSRYQTFSQLKAGRLTQATNELWSVSKAQPQMEPAHSNPGMQRVILSIYF